MLKANLKNHFNISDFDESVLYVPANIYPIILKNKLYK